MTQTRTPEPLTWARRSDFPLAYRSRVLTMPSRVLTSVRTLLYYNPLADAGALRRLVGEIRELKPLKLSDM